MVTAINMVGESMVVADIGMTYVYYIYINYIFTYTLYLLIAYFLQKAHVEPRHPKSDFLYLFTIFAA